jgi:hypothetical protein
MPSWRGTETLMLIDNMITVGNLIEISLLILGDVAPLD